MNKLTYYILLLLQKIIDLIQFSSFAVEIEKIKMKIFVFFDKL